MRVGVCSAVVGTTLLVASLVVCTTWGSAENAQLPPYSRDRSGARELSRQEAPAILGIPEDQLEKLIASKDRLTQAEFEGFREQFGRLSNGMPTLQVDAKTFFVLIALTELDKAPPKRAAEDARRDFEAIIRTRDEQPEDPRNSTPEDVEGRRAKRPHRVDHSPSQTAVRNQGQRNTCVAFAACADLEAMLLRRNLHQSPDLSENFAYYLFMQAEGSTPCKDVGLATWRAAGHLTDYLVCEEHLWPYDSTDPGELRAKGKCNTIDTPPGTVNGQNGWGITKHLQLPAGTEVLADESVDIRDTDTLEMLLESGHNIVVGAVYAWQLRDAGGVIDVRRGVAGQPIYGEGGHAMLIVGYDRTNEKLPYFIVKNSWGHQYGQKGYLNLTYDYMRTYARYGYVTTDVRMGQLPPPAR